MEFNGIPYQTDNPTKEERYSQLKYLLNTAKRPEDFDNIIKLLSPPQDILSIAPKSGGKNIRVGIIGGGEAGLAAAFELRKIGCDITIFEATERIGGRILTIYFDNEKRYYGELGAMRVPVSHDTTWHYINLFKLSTGPFVTKNVNGLFYIRNGRARNDPQGISVMQNIYPKFNLTPEERSTPWQKLAGRIADKYLNSLPPEIRKELLEIKPEYSEPIRQIDMMSCRQAYESTGLSQDAISMLGYLSTFDASFFRLGLTEILQEAYTIDFGYTYRINGGTIKLPEAFYRALLDEIPGVYGNISREELGKIVFRLNSAVDGIYKCSDGKVTLEVRETKTEKVNYEAFDYIICAIPFSSLRRVKLNPLFSVMKMQAIRELNYEPGHKTLFFLKNRFWECGNECQRIAGGSSSTDLPSISVYYPSDNVMPIPGVFNGWTLKPGATPDEPGVITAVYNLGLDAERLGNENPSLLLRDVKRYIEEIHGLPPGYITRNLMGWQHILWSHVQYIWGIGCLAMPENKILFSHNITQPEMDDRVFFAGEHISQKHVWQQGALQTAMIAANDVAKRIMMRREILHNPAFCTHDIKAGDWSPGFNN